RKRATVVDERAELVNGFVDLNFLRHLQPGEHLLDRICYAHLAGERQQKPLGEQRRTVTSPDHIAENARRDLSIDLHEQRVGNAFGVVGTYGVTDGKASKDVHVPTHVIQLSEPHGEPRDLHQLGRVLKDKYAPIGRDHTQRLKVAVKRLESTREVEDYEPALLAVRANERIELPREVSERLAE